MDNRGAVWIEELYKEGWLVKALDASGQPVLYNGRQIYKYAEYATAAELAFWRNENRIN